MNHGDQGVFQFEIIINDLDVINGHQVNSLSNLLGLSDNLTHISPKNPRWTPFLIDAK